MKKKLDINSAQGARKFLDGLHIAGKRVTQVTLKSGRELRFSDMSDDEAIHYARELFSWQKQERWALPQNDYLIVKETN